LPVDLYGEDRRNSRGVNLVNEMLLRDLAEDMQPFADARYRVESLLEIHAGTASVSAAELDTNPACPSEVVAEVHNASEEETRSAIAIARKFADEWDAVDVHERAGALERAADLLEDQLAEFMALCAREAGKTVNDAIAELREAADFCRYYAARAREQFGRPQILAGPTGEHNELSLHGRGVFVCISPWNFPLAIFMGQVSAALVAGNTVLAKPAEQTPLIAFRTNFASGRYSEGSATVAAG